jgi:hypothetical protein
MCGFFGELILAEKRAILRRPLLQICFNIEPAHGWALMAMPRSPDPVFVMSLRKIALEISRRQKEAFLGLLAEKGAFGSYKIKP